MIRKIEIGALDLDRDGDLLDDESVRMPIPEHLQNVPLKEALAWAIDKFNGA